MKAFSESNGGEREERRGRGCAKCATLLKSRVLSVKTCHRGAVNIITHQVEVRSSVYSLHRRRRLESSGKFRKSVKSVGHSSLNGKFSQELKVNNVDAAVSREERGRP